MNRTFGSLNGLRVPPAEALQQLRNVLQAYAEHNPQVAYCQSMNFLAAVLLLVVDEESAFWCLAAIVERLMPGHFSTSMAMPPAATTNPSNSKAGAMSNHKAPSSVSPIFLTEISREGAQQDSGNLCRA